MRWLLVFLVMLTMPDRVAAGEDDIVGSAEVLDSDVMRIDGKFVMLFGVDGPERNQPCWERDGRVWPCQRVAARQLALYVDRAEVRCEPKGKPDPFRRIPAVCYVGEQNLNESMVRAGYALAVRDQSSDYVAAEDEARTKKVGMWRGSFIPPWEYREMMIRD